MAVIKTFNSVTKSVRIYFRPEEKCFKYAVATSTDGHMWREFCITNNEIEALKTYEDLAGEVLRREHVENLLRTMNEAERIAYLRAIA